MIKHHIDNELIGYAVAGTRYGSLTDEEKVRVYSEIRNAILQGIDKQLLSLVFFNSPNTMPNDVQSMLLWCLKLTNDKPTTTQKIKSEGSYADFDVDFGQEQRGQVYDYLAEKYGKERVTHVATFGTLAAKAAVRSAARALGFGVDVGSSIVKHIPNVPGIKLNDCFGTSAELRAMLANPDAEDPYKKTLTVALKLEGLPNSVGCHASACVISKDALTEYLPMMISKKDDVVLTQFDMKDTESLGCLKWDILGLKTLDVIKKTCELIKTTHNVDVDMEKIDVNDVAIYKVLNDGFNTGLFQFESDIASSFALKVKPQNINELSDLTSLMRPGPLSMGMMDSYVKAKFEGEKYRYGLKDDRLIEKIWEICYLSYGLMVYQEQVIKCFTQIAGFNEIEGDNARRAMGKKKAEEMAKLEAQFSAGGVKLGYDEADCKELFKQIAGFAEYGLGKVFSVCY